MSAFETASKLVVEEIGKKKLHHVPSEADSKSIKLLSVVEDGIIKEWSTADLQFNPKPFEEELGKIERRLIKDVDGALSAELKEVFGCGVSAGSRVSYEADFGKFRWRKLKNHHSFIKYLESVQLSISKKSGILNKFWEFFGSSRSFKIITSVVHTTSPTTITLIHQSEFGGSITFKEPKGQMFKVEAGLGRSKFDRKVLHLQSDTPIAYGCVDVFLDESGSMKVEDETIFRGKVTPKQSSSTSAVRETRGQKRKAIDSAPGETKGKKGKTSESAVRETRGQKRKAIDSAGSSLLPSGDASSTNVPDDSQETNRLREKVGEHKDEIERQKLYVSSLLQILSSRSVDQEEDSRPPSSSTTSTATELLKLQEKYDSLAMEHGELKERYEGSEEENRELKKECTRQEEVIAALRKKISTLERQINQQNLKIEDMDKRHIEGLADLEQRHKEGMADQAQRHKEGMADQEKRRKEGLADQEKRRHETMADLEKRLGEKIKESQDSAFYTMSLRLDKMTQPVSQTTKTEDDGQARASRQQARASRQREGAPMLGEHQEASIPSGTSPTEVEDRLLGRGGFGSVYLRFDTRTSKMVAVKRVPTVNLRDSREIKALRLEISLMKDLNHERIVQYIRSEVQSDSLCIYMEYMSGGSVSDQLDKEGPLGEATTKKYTRQILEGLDYLHRKNIIHRDIKGSNVLCDGNGNVKLADFGISKQLRIVETLSLNDGGNTAMVGSAHWMAPEVIRGEKYGTSVDIWSTGATAVEMLTAHPPWYQLGTHQVIFKVAILRERYVLDPTFSRDAENFLQLAFQPEEVRPRAEELLQHPWLRI